MANKDMLDKIADQITEDPESYDQSQWWRTSKVGLSALQQCRECGSVACIAGWALAFHHDVEVLNIQEMDMYQVPGTTDELASITDVASEVLELSESEAEVLFHSNAHPREYGTDEWYAMSAERKAWAMGLVLKKIAGGVSVFDLVTQYD